MSTHVNRALAPTAAGLALVLLLATAAAAPASGGGSEPVAQVGGAAQSSSASASAAFDARASVGPRLSASPNPIGFGRPLTIAGHGWPVIEFCERRVRLSLRSPQNALPIGTARVGLRGGFRRTWTPRRAEVGAGRWRLIARMRCESGRDGSAVPVVRSLTLRIR